MTFTVSDEQIKKFEEWRASHKKIYTGAIGGRYTWTFHPTSLGTITIVVDNMTKENIDLTEFEEW